MKIYVLRHGETDLNKAGLVSGVSNAHLTPKGINQAVEAAKEIDRNKELYNIKHIYVSPLERAQHTAKPIEEVLNLEAIIEPRIMEFNFGEYEKCSVEDVEFKRLRRQPYTRFKDGESILSAAHRIYSALDMIIEKHKNEDNNVLLVCHGTCARIIYTYFNNIDDIDYYNLQLNNCELITFNV
ncbi:MAG: histidine phosphatase family protein [Spirochaetaceae bacterium]|nr:histidine phosphatase family protein [Spirochaetaceae bacterium]